VDCHSGRGIEVVPLGEVAQRRAVGYANPSSKRRRTDPETARDAVNHALNVLEPRSPAVAAELRAADGHLLANLDFPIGW